LCHWKQDGELYTASFLQLGGEFSCSTEMREWDWTFLKPLENPLFKGTVQMAHVTLEFIE